VTVAKSHGARRGNRAVLDHAQKFQAELFFHNFLRKRQPLKARPDLRASRQP